MRIRKNKSKEPKNNNKQRSQSEQYASESDRYSKHGGSSGGTSGDDTVGRMMPQIEISDSVTVFTRVIDVNNLSESMSMSVATSNPAANTKDKSNRRNGRRKNDKDRKMWMRRNSSTTSFDRKVLDTEAKVQKQVRELATDSFCRDRSVGSNSAEKQKMRLMTTSGVLLFDGLVEDIPDDRSLQSIIRKEREEMACQYYEDRQSDILLTNKNTAGTNFIKAHKDYDPINSGFIQPNTNKKFYESDEDEEDDETRDVSVSVSQSKSIEAHSRSKDGGSSNSKSEPWIEQETFEPSIEVVINERSPLWKI